jgi:hypothetical protein
MNLRNESPQPVIDITVDINAVRGWVVSVSLGLVVILGLIGAAVSPIVDSHPVILTRERLAIKSYLDAVNDWISRFNSIALRFDEIEPVSSSMPSVVSAGGLMQSQHISTTAVTTKSLPSHIDLPTQVLLATLEPPISQPRNLYDRARQAEQTTQELQAIDQELQRSEVPTGLKGLHTLATATLQDFAAWLLAVLDAIGAPSAENLAAILPARQAALDSLTRLHDAADLPQEPTP